MQDLSDERSRKRRRLSNAGERPTNSSNLLHPLDSSISPPPLRRRQQSQPQGPKVMKSPFQLTRIKDLPPALNVDTVTLKDILGDPLIAECWEFNYLHDLDFLMDAFDEDVRDIVEVHVVHGFWKQEDAGRRNLMVISSLLPIVISSQIFLSKPVVLLGCWILTMITGASFQIRQYYSSYGVHARDVWHSPY
jgi:hypothetical protein